MIRSYEKRAEQQISGFQSPASDYLEGRLDITDKLVVDPHATFYFQMEGAGMSNCSIADGDLLIVDRSLQPQHGAVVIAFIAGSFACRIFLQTAQGSILKNDDQETTPYNSGEVQLWGVVTAVCRGMLPTSLKTGRYKNVCTL